MLIRTIVFLFLWDFMQELDINLSSIHFTENSLPFLKGLGMKYFFSGVERFLDGHENQIIIFYEVLLL